jgi:hypothetical protein
VEECSVVSSKAREVYKFRAIAGQGETLMLAMFCADSMLALEYDAPA